MREATGDYRTCQLRTGLSSRSSLYPAELQPIELLSPSASISVSGIIAVSSDARRVFTKVMVKCLDNCTYRLLTIVYLRLGQFCDQLLDADHFANDRGQFR